MCASWVVKPLLLIRIFFRKYQPIKLNRLRFSICLSVDYLAFQHPT